jgi:hypothetical protein
MQYGAEKLSLPTVKGWDWRFMNGGGYLTLLLVKSEEEKQRREERFRKAILPFIQDYDGLWNGFVDEILGRYENLKALNLDEATNIDLLDNFEETINTCRRMWEIQICAGSWPVSMTPPRFSTNWSPALTTRSFRSIVACGNVRNGPRRMGWRMYFFKTSPPISRLPWRQRRRAKHF